MSTFTYYLTVKITPDLIIVEGLVGNDRITKVVTRGVDEDLAVGVVCRDIKNEASTRHGTDLSTEAMYQRRAKSSQQDPIDEALISQDITK